MRVFMPFALGLALVFAGMADLRAEHDKRIRRFIPGDNCPPRVKKRFAEVAPPPLTIKLATPDAKTQAQLTAEDKDFVKRLKHFTKKPRALEKIRERLQEHLQSVFAQYEAMADAEVAQAVEASIAAMMKEKGYLRGLSPATASLNSLEKLIGLFAHKAPTDHLGNVWGNIVGSPNMLWSVADNDQGLKLLLESGLERFLIEAREAAAWEVVRRRVRDGRWTHFENPEVQEAYARAFREPGFRDSNPLVRRNTHQDLFR